MANLKGINGELVAQITTWLMGRFEPFVDRSNQLEMMLKQLKTGELQLEQIQIMEDGQIKILPPPPVGILPTIPDPPCVQEVTEAFGNLADEKNGKDDAKAVPDPKESGAVAAGSDNGIS
jgi:hypothetical protein